MSDTALKAGRRLADKVNPGMEETLEAHYGHLLPGMAERVVEFA